MHGKTRRVLSLLCLAHGVDVYEVVIYLSCEFCPSKDNNTIFDVCQKFEQTFSLDSFNKNFVGSVVFSALSI